MSGGKNLAQKYSKTIDERFERESQAVLALNSHYDFNGVDTVKVYSIPVVPMTDYTRSVFGERIEDYDEILLHPDKSDPFWNTHFGGAESRDALKSVKFPVLITTGFFDVFASGIFKMWEDMDPETKARSAFIIHAYHHGGNSDEQPYCFSPAATLEALATRNVARHLK